VVLALVAEADGHGYRIQQLVHERGFRFWTDLQRSSIYNALSLLERKNLITAEAEAGGGAERKVYRATAAGRARLRSEALEHLGAPGHPRSEIDLGLYALPFLPRREVEQALSRCLGYLARRATFLEERQRWCEERALKLPALAFERPLLALRAEIAWLRRLAEEYRAGLELGADQWSRYVYSEPPGEAEEAPTRSRRRRGKP
jgi:DNA-binding PadR family transcriptional regulator